MSLRSVGFLLTAASAEVRSEQAILSRHDYYFGNLDPFRMAANSEYQGALIPEKKHPRIDPYDNQRGEIEYEDRGLAWYERESDWDLIECYKKEV